MSDRCNAPPRSFRSVSHYFSIGSGCSSGDPGPSEPPTSRRPPAQVVQSPPAREARSPKAHRSAEQRRPAAPEETPGYSAPPVALRAAAALPVAVDLEADRVEWP